MVTLRANVNRELLAWARRSAGYSLAEAAQKILGKPDKAELIDAWEQGTAQPTVRQLFKLSDVYKRPLGTFYLSALPTDFTIPKDLRRLPGEVAGNYTPAFRSQIRAAYERREAAAELLADLGEEVPPFTLQASRNDDPENVATRIRQALDVTVQIQRTWRDRNRYRHLNEWRQRIESLGVLVFQIPDVEPSEMLGFALAETILPVVAVNRKLRPNGRIFTLLHEFVHLLIRESSISDFAGNEDALRPPENQRIEIFCNHVAGATLVPRDSLLAEPEVRGRQHNAENWSDEDVTEIAERYGVSREVIVRRLVILGRTTERFYRQKRAEYRAEAEARMRAEREQRDRGGENRATRAVSLLGSGFLRIVLESHNQGHIGLTHVSGLIGERLKWLPEIERKVT